MADDALSRKITELADAFIAQQQRYEDPAWQDAEHVRALLQGAIVASCFKPDGFQQFLSIVDVSQEQDLDGNYNSWFVVNFKSGAKVRISLEAIAPSSQ